jgi:hypothetical protein
MNLSLFGIPSILGGKKRSVKVNSDYPSMNNRLSHRHLSGSENPGANHVCASHWGCVWGQQEAGVGLGTLGVYYPLVYPPGLETGPMGVGAGVGAVAQQQR